MIEFANKYLGIDGLLHIIIYVIIMQVLMIVFPTMWSVVITLAIGIAKEVIYDYYLKKGTASWKDLLCDFVGILISCI